MLHLRIGFDWVARNNANYAPFRIYSKRPTRTNARILLKLAVVCWQAPKRSRSRPAQCNHATGSRVNLTMEHTKGCSAGALLNDIWSLQKRGFFNAQREREGVIKSFRRFAAWIVPQQLRFHRTWFESFRHFSGEDRKPLTHHWFFHLNFVIMLMQLKWLRKFDQLGRHFSINFN